MSALPEAPIEVGPRPSTEVLDEIQQRVLWLAVSIVQRANQRALGPTDVKVGGHQASSASMVSIMTALWFGHLAPGDRVSVKPHAAPVLHSINHLMGHLDRGMLDRLRDFGGLQSYPSRSKDPDPVDFSTGSVGIGATATIWSALAADYLTSHGIVEEGPGRHIALLGDAELDEGAIWEALADPTTTRRGNVMWVVDLNRQSLDRVVPDIAADRIARMAEALGWHVVSVKYGSRLREVFDRPGGRSVRRRIDSMANEEYQALLRMAPAQAREAFIGGGSGARALRKALADVSDDDLPRLLGDLGGHDIPALLEAYRAADLEADRPTMVLAYTVKGWGLPIQGHPSNHSALLSDEQWQTLGRTLSADADDPWRALPSGQAAEVCRTTGERLARVDPDPPAPCDVPRETGRDHRGYASTQQAFGRVLVDLARVAPDVAARVVTASPDVASSTNLGGWINRVGIWSDEARRDWFEEDSSRTVRWREGPTGQHIELGIAEGNLVGLLAELGATWSRSGAPLLPIGVLYDPFVTRALEPWSFGIYAGGQSILVGTPSGVSLATEGGAHQSVITPSVGVEQPGCVAWEPAFGQDLEWVLLHALGDLGHVGGTSSYLRLSTRPIDQALAAVPAAEAERQQRCRDVLAGGYLLRRAPGRPEVVLVGAGAVMGELCAAAAELEESGIRSDVVCLTSYDLVFRASRARHGLGKGADDVVERILPADRAAPLVTVLDGHPHTLAFLGGIHGVPTRCLGVDDFGQVGQVGDLYRHFGIDTETIVGAALDAVSEQGTRTPR